MSIEEAIKTLDYKINMYKEDVFIGDLDKTNIEAIKKVLKEIERLNKENKELKNVSARKSRYIDKKDLEIGRLNNIINECANDILKELKENNHLSYGVALAIRQKLLNYKELKGVDKECK